MSKRLYLSRTDSKLTGLCGGIGQFLGIDPTIVRVIAVVASFISFGTVLLLYFAASFIIPKEPYSGPTDANYYHFNPYR